MGDVLEKLGWGLFSLAIAVLMVATFSSAGDKVKQTQLFKQKEFGIINTYKSWDNFANELNISKRSSKIQDFDMVLTKNNKIYSVNFNVIEESTKGFSIYQYNQCLMCETKQENKVSIEKDVVDSWSGYADLVDTEDFFKDLQLVKESQQRKNNYDYSLIRSSGRYEETALEGEYYFLEGARFKPMNPPESNEFYTAFNFQVMGNNFPEGFSSGENTTKTFLVSDYQSKKYD